MPPLLSRWQSETHSRSHLILPIVAFLASVLAYIGTPAQHSLLSGTITWTFMCAVGTSKTGVKRLFDVTPSKKLAWASGALFVLAQVCDRGVDGSGIWWAKTLLPVTIYAAQSVELFSNERDASTSPASPGKPSAEPVRGSYTMLTIVTACALATVYSSVVSNSSTAIGLSYPVIAALAWLLLERAQSLAKHPGQNGSSIVYSANGFLAQPSIDEPDGGDTAILVIRDVSSAAAIASVVAEVALETRAFGGNAIWTFFGHDLVRKGSGPDLVAFIYTAGLAVVYMSMYIATILLIQRRGALATSFVPLLAAVCAQVIGIPSFSRLWFAGLSITATFLFLEDTEPAKSRQAMKATRALTLAALGSFAVLAFLHLHGAAIYAPASENQFSFNPPVAPLQPLQNPDSQTHPVDQLVRNAEASWAKTLNSQSKSLDAAVAEYKRRYGIHPPPHFDKWFEFAKRKNVQLIDEYDTIHQSLMPFWGLPPATIRARVREALGFEMNNLIGLHIRDGKAARVEGGPDWQRNATVGMMNQFIDWLPDMDLAFNIHDEPRVVVPHDELSRLVRTATDERMPEALAKPPKNIFSPRPKDVKGGKRVEEVKTTRFNVFAHQPTWIPSRLSCPPDSPARGMDEFAATDNLTAYALGDLGFVYNQTAFSDVCNSPSLGKTHGFFDRPNAFNVVHELFPIFSQSKMSSFQDILYPSPWYWDGKVTHEDDEDMKWEEKGGRLWWRGSTTGGFSRDGGWRRQHRQGFVRRMNAIDQAKVLDNANKDAPDALPDWQTKEVARQNFKDIMDVHFSGVGQCDPGDCDAQREFFDIVEPAAQHEAWKFKYLLDLDGNAFSGRFYAFLESHSLTFKMAVFREWHEEWIKPWVHYIPLSLRGEEGLEVVRYFVAEIEGKQQGPRMAEAGRDWARKALRNEDFEVWFFRLLLEYGRLVDDNRAGIGFSGS